MHFPTPSGLVMNFWNRPRPFLLAAALAALTVEVRAADKLDLTRVDAVPATEQIPIVDFLRPLLLQYPQINLAGTHAAALVASGEDRHNLMVYDLKTLKTETFDAGLNNDVPFLGWLDDQHLVFGISLYKGGAVGYYMTEVGSVSRCLPLLQYVGSRMIAIPLQNRMSPLVEIIHGSRNSGRTGDVVTLNTAIQSGEVFNMLQVVVPSTFYEKLDEANQKHISNTVTGPAQGLNAGFLADRAGLLDFAFTAEDGLFSMYRLNGTNWEKSPLDLEAVDVIDCGRTHGEVTVLGPRQEGRPRALQFMDGATGQPGDVLIQDKGYDFDGYLYRDPATHAILGATYDRSGPQMIWFDENYRGLQKFLDGYFPGLIVRVLDSDNAGKIFLVSTYSDRQPLVYYSLDLEKHSVGLLKKSAPWIDPKRMQPMNVLKFKTRDGRQLDAYLTLPAGASKQNPPPLVVMPSVVPVFSRGNFHDPVGRVSWTFSSDAQFFASRGYAVLRVNHRGSSGYGWMFPKEDAWDLTKMGNDVNDATKTLVASGLVDGRRVAILGWDFSAGLALSGMASEPALYQSAVAINPVCDWSMYVQDKKLDQYDSPLYGYLTRHLGDPKKDQKKFEDLSPIHHLDQVHAAVLVAYEKTSPDMLAQSRGLLSRLDKLNIPHEGVAVGDDQNGLTYLKYRVELYSRVEAFLAKNLSPVAPPLAAAAPASTP